MQASTPSAILHTLREAVFADRRVAFAYIDRAGSESNRTVDPLGLVAKAGIWYLVARDRDAVKTFRVQRISDVRLLERPFMRPPDFDLAAYWESVASTLLEKTTPLRATIHMTDRALANAQAHLDVKSQTLIPDASPRKWSVDVEFHSADAAEYETLGWTSEAVVMEPPALRERLAARARALLERYGSTARGPGNLL